MNGVNRGKTCNHVLVIKRVKCATETTYTTNASPIAGSPVTSAKPVEIASKLKEVTKEVLAYHCETARPIAALHDDGNLWNLEKSGCHSNSLKYVNTPSHFMLWEVVVILFAS